MFGAIVAVKESLSPSTKLNVVLFSEMLSTLIILDETITSQLAVLPLVVVAVIVTLPSPTAVTKPFSTVATFGSEVAQVIVLFVALLGLIVAIKETASLTYNSTDWLSRETDST